MRVVHTADLHIGATRLIPGYLERQREMLRNILQIAQEQSRNDKTILVVAGDIFHTLPKPEERKLFLTFLLDAKDAGIQVLMVAGNHDLWSKEMSHLDQIKLLCDRGVLKDIHLAVRVPEVVLIDDVEFILLPNMSLSTEELNDIVSTLSSKPTTIVVFHERCLGSLTDVGWKSSRGPVPDERLKVSAWMCGDIHKFQRIGKANAFYPGSPIQHDFGEAPPKGVLIWEIGLQGGSCNFREIRGVRPLITLDALPEDLKDLPDAWIRLRSMPQNSTLPPHVVKVEPLTREHSFAGAEDLKEKLGSNLLTGLDEVLFSAKLDENLFEEARKLAEDVLSFVSHV